MARIKVAAVALNQTPLDWDGNATRIIESSSQCGDASIICFPELCISGYGCEDLFSAPWVRTKSLQTLAKLINEPKLKSDSVYLVGLPIEHEGKVYSGVAVFQSGKLLGITCKKNLVNDGIHYEERWFRPWTLGLQVQANFLEIPSCPIGDVWYDFGGITVGLEICHDAWVEHRHSKHLADRGVQIICNPSASHFSFGKRAAREQLIRTASREHCQAYVYANLLGCESGRAIYDGDRVIAQGGTITASGERLVVGDYAVTVSEIEINGNRQGGVGFFGARRHPPVRGLELKTTNAATTIELQKQTSWEQSSGENLLFEEFSRAVSLGLYDYGRKSGALRFALSLSGGADSAACAVLVDLMTKRISGDGQEVSTAQVLTCAYQATAQSTQSTRSSALELTKGLGIKLIDLDVQGVVDNYLEIARAATGKIPTWKDDDLALQNIQSRVRSPSIWLIANLTNSLLLTTANRSEAAVGYATMDGDTSGGLAPLGGVDKHFIRSWLRWMQSEGPSGFRAYPELALVNGMEPTAELRPGGTQTDEGDLMPYEILAALERAFVRYYRAPEELSEILLGQFGTKYSSPDLERWTKRFLSLFFKSQWKRERYAPAFHIDDFSLDPKTWLRMPILSKCP